jgi:hypothetical protein
MKGNLKLKFGSIIIIGFLLFSSLIFPSGFDALENDSNELVNDEIETTEIQSLDPLPIGNRAPQDDAHGGEWVDSFKDDTRIDWAMSDHLRLNDGDAFIDYSNYVDPNAIAFYRFNEGLGTTAFDATINNNDGVLGGDGIGTDLPIWTTGKFGNALKFDGINDYVDINLICNDLITQNGTIEAWVKLNSDFEPSDTTQIIFSTYETDDTRMLLRFSMDTGHEGSIGWSLQGKGKVYTNQTSWNGGEWYYIAATCGSSGLKIYVNGQLADLLNPQDTTSGFNDINPTKAEIGTFYVTTLNYAGFFNGIIDEVGIYKCALSAEEIKDHYENSTYRNLRYGNVSSKSISIPPDMHWDTLMINKTEPEKTYLNITILNALNNQPIPGSPTYLENGEVDISYIDPVQYPAIKLNATLEGDGSTTPELHYWAVSWNRSNTWQDTLFGGEKVESAENVKAVDGDLRLEHGGIDLSAVAMWHFDEGSGIIAYDATTNDNDGTLGGDGIGTDLPTWTIGKFGKALSFDGNNDYINITKNKIFNIWNKFSISTWIKLNSHKYYNRIINDYGFVFATDNDGRIWARIWDDTYWSDNYYSSQQISIGNWTHLAITFDSASVSNNLKAYVNGNLDPITLYCQHPANNTGGSLIIGSGSHTHSNSFNGIIDDIVIYDQALTAEEIKDIYQYGSYSSEYQGKLISESINLPANMCWDTLTINKTELQDTTLYVTILDGTSNQPLSSFEYITDTEIDLSPINSFKYNSIKLQAAFGSNSANTSVLHDWSLNWTENTAPKLINIDAPNHVYRTKSVMIMINLSDREESENNLTLKIEYKSPVDTNWQTSWMLEPIHIFDKWTCFFTPMKNAELGDYSFRVTVNDSFQYLNITTHTDFIKVINHNPTTPDVYISPTQPRTGDMIKVIAENSTDVETLLTQLKYWYRWYKNDSYLPEFDNETLIHNSNTLKNEIWRCIVYPFDGDVLGTPGEAEVIIQNSPPELVEGFSYYEMIEDSSVSLENKLLTIFNDLDNDSLDFSSMGDNNIKVDIIQENGTIMFTPTSNWFGMEAITFYANDTYSKAASESVVVEVKPANDLPQIVQIGNQFIKDDNSELGFTVLQNEWLNLSIVVEDIDGDVERGLIQYMINNTQNNNLYLSTTDQKLVFQPENTDVGRHYLKISISDNNETPIILISQNIWIDVVNVNDPPSVRIITPTRDTEYMETEDINLECQVQDLDLLIPNSTERFTYLWTSNQTGLDAIGTEEQLMISNLTLSPGYYNITVSVKDTGGKTGFDHINIVIKAAPVTPIKDKTDTSISGILIWLGILILVVIIVMVILFFIFARLKKRKRETVNPPQEEELSLDATNKPEVNLVALAQASEPSGPQVAQPQQPQTVQISVPQQEPTIEESDTHIPAPSAGLPTVEPPPQLPLTENLITPAEQPIAESQQMSQPEIPPETVAPEVEASPPEVQPESIQQPTIPEQPQVQEQPVQQQPQIEPTLVQPQSSEPTAENDKQGEGGD